MYVCMYVCMYVDYNCCVKVMSALDQGAKTIPPLSYELFAQSFRHNASIFVRMGCVLCQRADVAERGIESSSSSVSSGSIRRETVSATGTDVFLSCIACFGTSLSICLGADKLTCCVKAIYCCVDIPSCCGKLTCCGKIAAVSLHAAVHVSVHTTQ